MEDITKDYSNGLIHTSTIHVARRRLDGGVRSCHIHDLLRDLVISKVKNSKLFEVDKNINPTNPILINAITKIRDVTFINVILMSTKNTNT